MNNTKIEKWAKLALKNEDIFNYNIVISGKASKDDGYIGNIYFVCVNGTNKEGHSKKINLVIKVSKESKKLREQTPISRHFKREIFVYSRILKSFNDLQHEMTCENLLDFMPYCYVTKIFNESELLVFEDLKLQGYSAWDRRKTMTYEHVKLVLEAYGKWHAFSFALKEKKREVFANLVENTINGFIYFFEKTEMIDLVVDLFQNSRDVAIRPDETEVLGKLQFSKKDAYYILKELVLEDPNYRVISHGDCWTNNFFFKFDKYETQPTSVRVLDWQCSGLSSPAIDLSHFLYSCSDTEKCRDVSTLLPIYHNSLSQCLTSLGCDPNKLFPYAKLVEHWKRFSKYGILIHGFVVKFTLWDSEDAQDFAEVAEKGNNFLENFNMEITDKQEYHRRIRNNLLHYVQNLELGE